MSIEASRLKNIRTVYSGRRGARTRSDTAFLLYCGLLILAVSVFPLLRALILVLLEPGVTAALAAPTARDVVAVSSGVLLIGMLLLGRLRGPVAPSRFFTSLLAVNDMRRRRSLRALFVTSGLVVVSMIVITWLILGGVLLVSNSVLHEKALVALLAWFCMGLWASVLWLAGQSLKPAHVWLCALGIVILSSVVFAVPALAYVLPWSWTGVLWPTASSGSSSELLPMVLISVGAVVSVPKLLDRITSMDLLERGKVWESVGTAVFSGEISFGLGMLRSRPRIGRTWAAVHGRSRLTQALFSDLVGAMRSPGRCGVGLLATLGGVTVISFSLSLTTSVAWMVGSAGAVVAYLGLGVFADGFRHAAEATAAPPLYGLSPRQMYLMHAYLPTLVALIATGTAALVLLYTERPIFGTLSTIFLTAVIVLLRAFDSAKGNLPPSLLIPIPTSVIDPSGLFVLAWNADAVLLSLLAGGFTVHLLASGLLAQAIVALVIMGASVGIALQKRLAAL